MSRLWRGRRRGGVLVRAYGEPGPLVVGPLRVSGAAARTMLVAFGTAAWFVAATALFFDPLAGIAAGGLAAVALLASTRP